MIIIGIAGGTGSGKTTVVRKILEVLPPKGVAIIPQDAYYKDNKDVPMEERKYINFDHPDSIEFDLLEKHLKALKAGKTIARPVYSYITSTRANETVPIEPKRVIIVEGILLFTSKKVRDICDIKIFVDADPDDRLLRVIKRDIDERGRSVHDVMERYEHTVKAMHDQFIEPTKRYADIIVPQGGENHVAIDIIASMIKDKLRKDREE